MEYNSISEHYSVLYFCACMVDIQGQFLTHHVYEINSRVLEDKCGNTHSTFTLKPFDICDIMPFML